MICVKYTVQIKWFTRMILFTTLLIRITFVYWPIQNPVTFDLDANIQPFFLPFSIIGVVWLFILNDFDVDDYSAWFLSRPQDVEVDTPQGIPYHGRRLAAGTQVCGVSILRAGEALEPSLCAVCKDVRLGKILIQTNPDTFEPELHYIRLPSDIKVCISPCVIALFFESFVWLSLIYMTFARTFAVWFAAQRYPSFFAEPYCVSHCICERL